MINRAHSITAVDLLRNAIQELSGLVAFEGAATAVVFFFRCAVAGCFVDLFSVRPGCPLTRVADWTIATIWAGE